MGWLELRLVLPRAAIEPISQRLFDAGASGVQEDFLPGEAPPPRQPWDRGPLPPLPSSAVLRSWWDESSRLEIDELVQKFYEHGQILQPADWIPVQEEDWANAWRAGFERLKISDRLVVAPPWEAVERDLVIEPGMAFGTGEHPTTRACLEAIDRLAQPGKTLLDIGCGTGVLALAGASLGMTIRGIDIDEDAIRASEENAARNGLKGCFDTTPVQELKGSWDLVVANLYAEVLVELAPHIEPTVGGRLVLAGILDSRSDLVLEALKGLELLSSRKDGEWICLEFGR
jgi:ribosomal protein L11 methyltransferase